jgi:hypothetical protein
MRKVLGSIPICSIVLRFSVLSFVVEFARDVGVGGTKWDGLPCGCWLGQLRNPADNSYGSSWGFEVQNCMVPLLLLTALPTGTVMGGNREAVRSGKVV